MSVWKHLTHLIITFRFPLLLLAAFLAFNASVVFGGRTLLPIAPSFTTQPNIPYGYSGPLSQTLTTIDPAGSLNISYIFDVVTAENLKQLTLPFWNPYQALGQPLLANGISSVLSPFQLITPLFTPAMYDWGYLLMWFLGTVFCYLYLTRLKLSQPAAALGALAFMLSGVYQLYLPVREYPSVVAWFPLLLYAVERIRQEPTWTWRHLVLALGVYGSIAGGQPEVYVMSLVFVLVYAVLRFGLHENRFSFFWAALPGTLGGILLSAPAWLTFYEYGLDAFSNHQDESTIGASHLPRATVGAFFLPFVLGRNNLAPQMAGWVVGASVFFALVACVLSWRKKAGDSVWLSQRQTIWILALLTLLLGAKVWGVPGFDVLGELPIFDRIIYARYASFILHFCLASLTAFGIHFFPQLSHKRWSVVMWIWAGVSLLALGLGMYEVRDALLQSRVLSYLFMSVAIFGGMGCVWLVSLPLVWKWMWHKLSSKIYLWYIYVGFSLLLAAIPISMSGYSLQDYAFITVDCFGVWVLSSLIFAFVFPKIHLSNKLIQLGSVSAIIVGVVALQLTIQSLGHGGLSQRYDPLTTPPYIQKLQDLTQGGLYRVYSMDGNPQPNFSTPFHLSNINNVEALMPLDGAEFMLKYLDNSVSPIWFAGNYSFGRSVGSTAVAQYLNHQRYFDAVGVRYLVTQQPLVTILSDTESVSSERQPSPIFQPLTTTFTTPADSFSGVQVLLSTYHKQNPGTVMVRLLSADGQELRRVTVEGRSILDDNLNTFAFEPITGASGQTFGLEVSFTPNAADSMIAAWVYPNHPALGFSYRVIESESLPLVYTDESAHMLVYESPEAQPRLYLATHTFFADSQDAAIDTVGELTNLNTQVVVEDSKVLLEGKPAELTIQEFTLDYNSVEAEVVTTGAGILTLSDTWAPGWKATLNGQPTHVLRVNGAFRGIQIEGPGNYQVRFSYLPPYWNVWMGLALIGAMVVGGWTIWGYKNQHGKKTDRT